MQQADRKPLTLRLGREPAADELPTAWRAFIRYRGDLPHGEMERLCIIGWSAGSGSLAER